MTQNTGGEAGLAAGAKRQKNQRFDTDAASNFLSPNPTKADLGFRRDWVSTGSDDLRPGCDRKRREERQGAEWAKP